MLHNTHCRGAPGLGSRDDKFVIRPQSLIKSNCGQAQIFIHADPLHSTDAPQWVPLCCAPGAFMKSMQLQLLACVIIDWSNWTRKTKWVAYLISHCCQNLVLTGPSLTVGVKGGMYMVASPPPSPQPTFRECLTLCNTCSTVVGLQLAGQCCPGPAGVAQHPLQGRTWIGKQG